MIYLKSENLKHQILKIRLKNQLISINKAGYMATLVACGWAGAVLEKVTGSSGQEPYAQKAQKRQKSNSRKSVRWSAVPVAPMSVYVGVRW